MGEREAARRRRYFEVSGRLALLDNASLTLRYWDEPGMLGWGRTNAMEVAGGPVFVKRIPITDVEREAFSTRNLYDLPLHYNYGVGSAGMGAVRELTGYLRASNWELSEEAGGFPLLYHHRVVPIARESIAVDEEAVRWNVTYWGGNERVGRYLRDRAAATHELVLFIEHVPNLLDGWLRQNPTRTGWALAELFRIVGFLRRRGVVHFDAHFQNVLTDGDRLYLTDFGLTLDRAFDLSEEERAFFAANDVYDYGRILLCLDYQIRHRYTDYSEPERRALHAFLGLPLDTRSWEVGRAVVENLEWIPPELMTLDEDYKRCVLKHREGYLLMFDFFAAMYPDDGKETPFPGAAMRRHLEATGVL
ncbi:MAG: hypothetical protein ACO1SV_02305 [Fimbriimonas sp.]